ncbi:hypothetical protein AgCh_031549 [Apium graveolens]
MGKVINSDYEVLGAHGLRVIDGSTFVQAPGTNPQATVMMLGRYMGIKILRKRLGKNTNTWEEEYPFIKNAGSFLSAAKNKEYDYIIVGGGTAGCPLAATLSQNFNVLLLERGGVPYGNKNTSLKNFHINLVDTSPNSPAQSFVVEGVFNVRPRILGGGSSINAGFYSRPSLRSLMELGLDSKLAYKSYPWIEQQIVHRPVLNPWQRAVKNALLQAGITPDNGYTFEHLYGTKISGTIFDKDGIRHGAAELLKSANPKNLDVLIHATAQKIVFDHSSGKPRAVGVIFKDENGEQHEATLSNNKKSEVILSSGAVGSPQLLLLSGIGPKSELEQMNISVVLNNQFVGKGMADNPQNNLIVPFNKPVEQSLVQTVGITREGVYIEASSGFGQSPSSIHYSHDNSTSVEEALDPGAKRETFQEQPLHTPVVERIVNTRDARTLMELNQYKYTNVPMAEEHMANLTSDELAEAIRLYRQEQTRLQEEAKLEEEPEESGDSQQSKRSVFDRIGAKGKKSKKGSR